MSGQKTAKEEEPKASRRVIFEKCDAEGCPIKVPHGHFESVTLGQSPTIKSLDAGDFAIEELVYHGEIDADEAMALNAEIREAGLNQEEAESDGSPRVSVLVLSDRIKALLGI